MNRNQIIAIASCSVLCIVIYLFAGTKKPKEGDSSIPVAQNKTPPTPESLNIENYLAEVNSKITAPATKERIEKLLQSTSYKELIAEYQKLDKPLAIAYYSMKLAETENKAESFVSAGDYNSTLMQTAPDEKARTFLSNNALECYQKAVALDSTNTKNRIRLAGAYMENGSQPMQGVGILLDIVRKDSNNVDALLMLGRFGIISGQFDKAIARLEKILYLQPQNSEALLLLAEAYAGQGNKQKAIELLERCKKSVTNPEAKKEIEKYIQNIKKPKG